MLPSPSVPPSPAGPRPTADEPSRAEPTRHGTAPDPREALTFDAIYRRWFHPVCEWIHAHGCREGDVDDLAQEVFLVVQRRLADFDGRNLAGWLYGISHRVVVGHRRRAWVRRWLNTKEEVDPDGMVATTTSPHDALEHRRRVEELGRILSRMSEKRRVAFVLFEVYGHSGQEIAETMAVPLKTMWSRLHQARADFVRIAAELDGGGSAEGSAPLKRMRLDGEGADQ